MMIFMCLMQMISNLSYLITMKKVPLYVHKASYIISSQNLNEALKRGINCVLQTATTFDNLDDVIRTAKNNGYKNKINSFKC